MPAFHYRSLDTGGTEHKGIIEADSPRAARQLLRDRGLLPVELRVSGDQGKNLFSASRTRKKYRPGTAELTLFTRQFATLLSASLPVEGALAAVAEQTEKPQTKGLILSVAGKVREGHGLAAALREFPDAFSDLYCATIAAGEKSGHLDIVLERLADYTEQQHEMRQKIMHALIYPAIMILVATGITGFLLEYVVPKMIAAFSNTGQALPLMTRILTGISAGIGTYGGYLLGGILLIALLLRWQIRHSMPFRTAVHRWLLGLPLLGYTIRTVNTARYARTFSILAAAGVPVVEAMQIASSLVTSLPIRNALNTATRVVREGASIHLALKQTGYFSPMSIHMIASGEASGQLENMLGRAAQAGENEISRLTTTLLALFEPAIILMMGAIVLFIVLAVLLPVFQLDQIAG